MSKRYFVEAIARYTCDNHGWVNPLVRYTLFAQRDWPEPWDDIHLENRTVPYEESFTLEEAEIVKRWSEEVQGIPVRIIEESEPEPNEPEFGAFIGTICDTYGTDLLAFDEIAGLDFKLHAFFDSRFVAINGYDGPDVSIEDVDIEEVQPNEFKVTVKKEKEEQVAREKEAWEAWKKGRAVA